jgi:ribonuclease HI
VGLIIHIDGGARGNPGPAGAGVVIKAEDGRPIHEAGYFLGRQTSNAAEYHALIRALTRAQRCACQRLCVYSDSELLVRQITGEYQVKSPKLAQLYQQVQLLLLKVSSWTVRHVPREENARADELANLAMDQRRDVIVFDADEAAGGPATDATTKRAPPAGDESPDQAARVPTKVEGWPTDRTVRVAIAQQPNAEACPAAGSCTQGDFTVTSTLPQALCVHAAHALLPTLLAILNTEPQEFAAVPTLTVRCGYPGCGAVFHLSPVRSSNGNKRREDG